MQSPANGTAVGANNPEDFDALLTPHQVVSLLAEETEHHAARRIALSVLLGQTLHTLVGHIRANPKLLEQAPRLLDCLERIAEGGAHRGRWSASRKVERLTHR